MCEFGLVYKMSKKHVHDSDSSSSSEQEHCENKVKIDDNAQVCNYCFFLDIVPGKRYYASRGRDCQVSRMLLTI